MADAKITLSVEGADSADQALSRLSASAKQAGVSLSEAGNASQASGAKVVSLKKYLDDLAPSTNNVATSFTQLHGTLSGMWENPTEAAKGLATAVGTDLTSSLGAVGVAAGIAAAGIVVVGAAALGLAENAASAGAALDDLHDKTDMSVPALSRYSNAAKVIGADMGQLTDVVFKLEKGLGENTDAFQTGLKKMGLSTEELKAAGPDRYLEIVATRLAAMPDSSERAAAGAAVLGKGYKDVAAALQDLGTGLEMTKDIQPWTAEQAKEAEHFEQQLASLKVHAEAFGMAVGRDLIGPISTFVSGVTSATSAVANFAGGFGGVLTPIYYMREAFGLASASVDVFRGKTGELPGVDGPAAIGVKALGTATQSYIDSIKAGLPTLADEKTNLRELEEAHQKLLAAQKEAAREMEAQRKLWEDYNSVGRNTMDTIEQLSGVVVEAIKYDLQRGETVSTLTKIYGVHETQIKAIQDEEKFLASVVDLTTKSFSGMAIVIPNLTDRTGKFREELESLYATFNQVSGGLSIAGDQLDHVIIPAFSSLPNVAAGAGKAIADAMDDANKSTLRWHDAMQLAEQALSRLAGVSLGPLLRQLEQIKIGGSGAGVNGSSVSKEEIVTAATQGGVALLASLTEGWAQKSKAGQVVNYAAQGAQYGAMVGTVVPGIGNLVGAGVGAGVGALVSALKVSPEEISARSTFADFQKLFGSLDDTIHAVGASYALMGRDGVTAEAAIKKALDATHDSTNAEEAALTPIIAMMQAAAKRATDIQTAVTGVTTAARAFGGTIPENIKASITELLKMQGITDAEKAALLGLAQQAAPTFEQLTQKASTYGITLDGLGPKFQQAQIDSTAKQIFQDFSDISDAGGDVGGVLFGMRDEISKLVSDSQKFGTAIPDNMKPLIQNLLDTGQLVDDSGDKFTDITKINFEDTPLDNGLKGLQDALDRLTDTLKNIPGIAAAAANGIGSTLGKVGGPASESGDIDPGQYGATGEPGYSYAGGSGGIVDFGSGRLAMLHGREGVFTEEQLEAGAGATYWSGAPVGFLEGDKQPSDRWPVQPLPSFGGDDGGPAIALAPWAAPTIWTSQSTSDFTDRSGREASAVAETLTALTRHIGAAAGVAQQAAQGNGDLHITLQLDGQVAAKSIVRQFRKNTGGVGSDAKRSLGLPVTTWT